MEEKRERERNRGEKTESGKEIAWEEKKKVKRREMKKHVNAIWFNGGTTAIDAKLTIACYYYRNRNCTYYY